MSAQERPGPGVADPGAWWEGFLSARTRCMVWTDERLASARSDAAANLGCLRGSDGEWFAQGRYDALRFEGERRLRLANFRREWDKERRSPEWRRVVERFVLADAVDDHQLSLPDAERLATAAFEELGVSVYGPCPKCGSVQCSEDRASDW